MKPNLSDPVIDEIREVRHRISERFAHDPARLVAYYVELQERYRDRLAVTTRSPEFTNHPGRTAVPQPTPGGQRRRCGGGTVPHDAIP